MHERVNPSAIVRQFHRALLHLDVVAVGGARPSCDVARSCAANECCGLQKSKDEFNKAIVVLLEVSCWRGAASVALRPASLGSTPLESNNARAVSLIP